MTTIREIIESILFKDITIKKNTKRDEFSLLALKCDVKSLHYISQIIKQDIKRFKNIESKLADILPQNIKDAINNILSKIYENNITIDKLRNEINKCRKLKKYINEHNFITLNDEESQKIEKNIKTIDITILKIENNIDILNSNRDNDSKRLTNFLYSSFSNIDSDSINLMCKSIFRDSIYNFYESIVNELVNKKLEYEIAQYNIENENDIKIILFEKLSNKITKKIYKNKYFNSLSNEDYEKILQLYTKTLSK